MDRLHNTGQDVYRLIITRRNGSEVLLPRGNGSSLPYVEILRGQRIAKQLTAELWARYGCRGYCLFFPILAPGSPHCAVMAVPDLDEIAPAGTCWKPLDAATYAAMESDEDRAVVEKSIEQWDHSRQEPSQAPFARPEWLAELLAWSQQQLGPLDLRLTGAFNQLNASPTFSLIRLETNDSAVWFKATGDPNRHELRVAACVARLFPGFVPEVLGIHSAWNAWLMPEVPGRRLDDVRELASWHQAAEDLARLQIGSIGQNAELFGGGCRDLRLPNLIAAVDPWIDRMRGLMAAQEKQAPARLTDPELSFLRDSLEQACLRFSEIGLPNTLGHLDFSPGNIIVSSERCVFLDWAEGCVTNPLITFEYLREHFRRNCTQEAHTAETLVAAYSRPWQSTFFPDAIKKAMVLSPLVAVFAYAAGSNAWQSSKILLEPSIAGHFRSLTRRMHREAALIAARRELCPV
jgi:hypothetical protein